MISFYCEVESFAIVLKKVCWKEELMRDEIRKRLSLDGQCHMFESVSTRITMNNMQTSSSFVEDFRGLLIASRAS